MIGWFNVCAAKIVEIINRILNAVIKFVFVKSVEVSMTRKRADYLHKDFDYIRVSSLEFISHEIASKGVLGNVAELGVYRGDFAAKINLAFPDKKFYLFDTFEGFDKRDKDNELQNNYSTGDQDFSNTSVDLVLSKMRNPKQCIVKKGYFPDSAISEGGIEDTFCFVSIDTDLFQPIYDGLKFFYPKLARGGYIFVHDYNNDKVFKGVKEAVQKFSSEENAPYFPLSDSWGSVVFMK